MSIRETKRYGNFDISEELLLQSDTDLLLETMGNFIVTKCEFDYSRLCMRYTAWSKLFEPTAANVVVPDYTIIMETEEVKNEDGSFTIKTKSIKAERLT